MTTTASASASISSTKARKRLHPEHAPHCWRAIRSRQPPGCTRHAYAEFPNRPYQYARADQVRRHDHPRRNRALVGPASWCPPRSACQRAAPSPARYSQARHDGPRCHSAARSSATQSATADDWRCPVEAAAAHGIRQRHHAQPNRLSQQHNTSRHLPACRPPSPPIPLGSHRPVDPRQYFSSSTTISFLITLNTGCALCFLTTTVTSPCGSTRACSALPNREVCQP